MFSGAPLNIVFVVVRLMSAPRLALFLIFVLYVFPFSIRFSHVLTVRCRCLYEKPVPSPCVALGLFVFVRGCVLCTCRVLRLPVRCFSHVRPCCAFLPLSALCCRALLP